MSDLYPGAALGVAIGFLAGIVLHHVAHARMAIATGDRSVKLSGRTSLSIKRHADALGTYVLTAVWAIVVLFGGPEPELPMFSWGRPQAGNPYVTQQKRSVILVALAGPLATLAIAAVAGLARRSAEGEIGAFLGGITLAAAYLTVFEILPIPGRDGGRILATFLSPSARLRFLELAEYHAGFIIAIFVIPSLLDFTNPMVGFANQICERAGGLPCAFLMTPVPI